MGENDLTWEKMEPNQMILEKARFRTGENSVAEILINEKVVITVRENTLFKMHELKNRIVLELIKGSINVNSETVLTNLIVKSLLGDVQVLSGNILLKNINNNFLISVFDNKAVATLRSKKITIPQGYGLEITPLLTGLEPFPLPGSPVPDYPADKSIISSGVELKWEPVNEAILYRMELSIDKDFIKIVMRDEIDASKYSTKDLTDGQYFWRVSAVNRKNLEGPYFGSSSFIIQGQAPSSLLISDNKKDPDVKDPTETVEDKKESDKDEEDEAIPPENTTNSIILGSIILLSIIILIIL